MITREYPELPIKPTKNADKDDDNLLIDDPRPPDDEKTITKDLTETNEPTNPASSPQAGGSAEGEFDKTIISKPDILEEPELPITSRTKETLKPSEETLITKLKNRFFRK